MLKLYNTLTKKVEELKPVDEQNIRVYTCGPTVYNAAQIGNLMSFIFADTLRRTLVTSGYNVTQVINYTDVDDKTIAQSQKDYPKLEPLQALEKLTLHYTALFLEDMKQIGNDINAVTFVRATDHIEAMKQLITKLHDNGFAYIADDGIYFSIDAYRKSGKTYGQLLKIDDKNTSRARIQNDEYDKESVHDFSLWKVRKPNEPAWEFTVGDKNVKGRPGWHIECSAMSRQILGQPFDIHTGGVDLIFPHHENEIAQSTAGENNPTLATIFAHNEHLLIGGNKMSKSLHNFYTLNDIREKGYDPLVFRVFILQAHYRKQAHFSWENLDGAQNRLKNWKAFSDLRFQAIEAELNSAGIDDILTAKPEASVKQLMENDLNTPEAIIWLDKLSDEITVLPQIALKRFNELIEFFDIIFGLNLLQSKDITDEQKKLLAERERARKNKDFAKSDQLRDELKQQAIGVRDTDHGQIWYRLDVV